MHFLESSKVKPLRTTEPLVSPIKNTSILAIGHRIIHRVNAKKERDSHTANQQKVLLIFLFLVLFCCYMLSTGSLTDPSPSCHFLFVTLTQFNPKPLPFSRPTVYLQPSQIKRLEREASSLRKRIFTLRINKSEFIAGSEQNLKLTAVILELDNVLQLKNRQLLDIRLGTSL